MNSVPTKSAMSRQRILQAAGRAFRSGGYGGTGVDTVARGAELTSGAFYFHFSSKLDVFVAALRHGIAELRDGIAQLQGSEGPRWLRSWVDFYLGYKRTCTMEEGCSFPALAPEVERAGEGAQQAYEEELKALLQTLERGLPGRAGKAKREKTLALLAMMSGAVTMSRAVHGAEFSEEIAAAVRKAALAMAE